LIRSECRVAVGGGKSSREDKEEDREELKERESELYGKNRSAWALEGRASYKIERTCL
jgi:hypothetical protein